MNNNECQNCKFFFASFADSGECRRYPPQQGNRKTGKGNPMAEWVEVGNTQWCGEYLNRLDQIGANTKGK